MSKPISSTFKLPIIDISPYLPSSTVKTSSTTSTTGTNDRTTGTTQVPSHNAQLKLETSKQLHEACRDYGFFYLNLAGFATEEEMSELAEYGRRFFHQSQDVKDEIRLSLGDGARGYQRLKENVTMGKADNHEGIDFYKPVPNPDKSKPIWGENQWPREEGPNIDPKVKDFRVRFERWIEKMHVLGLAVMEAMAYGLGASEEEWEELRSKVTESFWVMRIIGYPPLPSDHDGFSCGAHKDYGCLTFLYADPTPNALQVFLPSSSFAGKTLTSTEEFKTPTSSSLPKEQGAQEGIWIQADPIAGHVVCNIGEMWETWSKGLYKSTLHRVIHRSSNYRVSVPFFFEPNYDALVEPLPAAVRKSAEEGRVETTEQYTPIVYGEFLQSKVAGNFSEHSKKKDRY